MFIVKVLDYFGQVTSNYTEVSLSISDLKSFYEGSFQMFIYDGETEIEEDAVYPGEIYKVVFISVNHITATEKFVPDEYYIDPITPFPYRNWIRYENDIVELIGDYETAFSDSQGNILARYQSQKKILEMYPSVYILLSNDGHHAEVYHRGTNMKMREFYYPEKILAAEISGDFIYVNTEYKLYRTHRDKMIFSHI